MEPAIGRIFGTTTASGERTAHEIEWKVLTNTTDLGTSALENNFTQRERGKTNASERKAGRKMERVKSHLYRGVSRMLLPFPNRQQSDGAPGLSLPFRQQKDAAALTAIATTTASIGSRNCSRCDTGSDTSNRERELFPHFVA